MLASVNQVEVDRAKKYAIVWLSVIQGEDEALLKLVESHRRELEAVVFSALSLSHRLELNFHIDTGPRHAQRMAELISQTK